MAFKFLAKTRNKHKRNILKHTKKNKKTKRTNKNKKTKKGGMWRLIPKSKLPQAERQKIETLERSNAQPYDFGEELPNADAEYLTAEYGKYDNPTREEELQDIYEDIKQNGAPIYAADQLKLLKKYPEFDVNITYHNRTMLNEAIDRCLKSVARSIISSPYIKESTLQKELDYLDARSKRFKLNKTQNEIKEMIENKLQIMHDTAPSAPPLEDYVEPSAPPLEEDVESSVPLLEDNVESSVPPLEDDVRPSAPQMTT